MWNNSGIVTSNNNLTTFKIALNEELLSEDESYITIISEGPLIQTNVM